MPKIKDFFFRNLVYEEEQRKKISQYRKTNPLVHSIDNLVCKYHKNSKFVPQEDELIVTYKNETKKIEIYVCETCNEKNLENKTTAYYCSGRCKAYIYGLPIRKFRPQPKDLRILNIGSDEIQYSCKLCTFHLGSQKINKK